MKTFSGKYLTVFMVLVISTIRKYAAGAETPTTQGAASTTTNITSLVSNPTTTPTVTKTPEPDTTMSADVTTIGPDPSTIIKTTDTNPLVNTTITSIVTTSPEPEKTTTTDIKTTKSDPSSTIIANITSPQPNTTMSSTITTSTTPRSTTMTTKTTITSSDPGTTIIPNVTGPESNANMTTSVITPSREPSTIMSTTLTATTSTKPSTTTGNNPTSTIGESTTTKMLNVTESPSPETTSETAISSEPSITITLTQAKSTAFEPITTVSSNEKTTTLPELELNITISSTEITSTDSKPSTTINSNELLSTAFQTNETMSTVTLTETTTTPPEPNTTMALNATSSTVTVSDPSTTISLNETLITVINASTTSTFTETTSTAAEPSTNITLPETTSTVSELSTFPFINFTSMSSQQSTINSTSLPYTTTNMTSINTTLGIINNTTATPTPNTTVATIGTTPGFTSTINTTSTMTSPSTTTIITTEDSTSELTSTIDTTSNPSTTMTSTTIGTTEFTSTTSTINTTTTTTTEDTTSELTSPIDTTSTTSIPTTTTATTTEDTNSELTSTIDTTSTTSIPTTTTATTTEDTTSELTSTIDTTSTTSIPTTTTATTTEDTTSELTSTIDTTSTTSIPTTTTATTTEDTTSELTSTINTTSTTSIPSTTTATTTEDTTSELTSTIDTTSTTSIPTTTTATTTTTTTLTTATSVETTTIGAGNITVVELNKTGIFYEGNSARFTCIANVWNAVGKTKIVWRLNTAVLIQFPSSRWKITKRENDPLKPWEQIFDLSIQPLHADDGGNVSCTVSDDTVSSYAVQYMNVTGRPAVMVSPLTAVVNVNEPFIINCTIIKSFVPNTNVFLYKDDKIVNTTQALIRTVIFHLNTTNDAEYSCEAHNAAGAGGKATSKIRAISPTDVYKYCPEETDNFNTTWEKTVELTTYYLPCHTPYTGNVSRVCNNAGKWEDPNYSKCVREKLEKLNKLAESLNSGMEIENVTNILDQLADQTKTDVAEEQNNELRSGDLETSSSVLNNLASYINSSSTDKPTTPDTKQLETFASTCNNLLNDKNIPGWIQLKNLNLTGVTRIAEALTTYTKAYIKSSSKEFNDTVESNNLVVQIGKTSSSKISFPNRSNTTPKWINESATTVEVTLRNHNGAIGYSSAFYRNISDLFHDYKVSNGTVESTNNKSTVNSFIVDVSIDYDLGKDDKLVVEFQNINPDLANPVCSFWDFNVPGTPNGAWSSEGAKYVESSDGNITRCEYSHTTNFAILMSPGKTPAGHLLALSLISIVGCSISILSLFITVFMYYYLWRYLKSDRAVILVNLCIALIVSYLLFFIGVTRTENKVTCTAIAVTLHYIFLVDFFLMLAEGIEVALSVMYVFQRGSKSKWLVSLSWLIPLVIVGISAGASQLEGYGNTDVCWLTIESGLLWAFVVPVLLIILINVIILSLVLKTMFSSHGMLTKSAREKGKTGVRSICVLLPLFGITWILGVFSVNEDVVAFQYLFAIFNSLQGVMIFLFHCLFNKKVREGIQHKIRKKKSSQYTRSTSQNLSKKNSTEKTDESQYYSSRDYERSNSSQNLVMRNLSLTKMNEHEVKVSKTMSTLQHSMNNKGNIAFHNLNRLPQANIPRPRYT